MLHMYEILTTLMCMVSVDPI